jgi:hypothetical protein
MALSFAMLKPLPCCGVDAHPQPSFDIRRYGVDRELTIIGYTETESSLSGFKMDAAVCPERRLERDAVSIDFGTTTEKLLLSHSAQRIDDPA